MLIACRILSAVFSVSEEHRKFLQSVQVLSREEPLGFVSLPQAAEKSITSKMESGGTMAKEVEQIMKHEVKKKLKQYSSKVSPRVQCVHNFGRFFVLLSWCWSCPLGFG